MTEKEIWNAIREEIKLTDLEITKIIIRLVLWHNYIYRHSSYLDISGFFSKYIHNAETFEKACHGVLYFNLYTTGFINFCSFLKLPCLNQKTLLDYATDFAKLEPELDEIMMCIEEHLSEKSLPATFSNVFNVVTESRDGGKDDKNDYSRICRSWKNHIL